MNQCHWIGATCLVQSSGHGSVLKLPASTGRAACAWQQLRPPTCRITQCYLQYRRASAWACSRLITVRRITDDQFAESVQCSLEHSMFGSSFCLRATNGSLPDISDSRGSEALGQSRVGSGLTRQSRFGTVAQQRKFRLGHEELAPDPSCPACQSPIDSPLVLHRILNRPGTISISSETFEHPAFSQHNAFSYLPCSSGREPWLFAMPWFEGSRLRAAHRVDVPQSVSMVGEYTDRVYTRAIDEIPHGPRPCKLLPTLLEMSSKKQARMA